MTAAPAFQQPEPGLDLPELSVRPGEVQLFRFSAVSWNAHRIHYDRDYARQEGYERPLVHSQLHGCLLSRVVTGWLGPRGRMIRIAWQNRAPAFAGDLLLVRARVREVHQDGSETRVELDLESRNAAGTVLVQGTACAVLEGNHSMHSPPGQTP
jgi:hydroxyacyl-ACP dehydratase HTD2-like protein with hotdog domain